MHLYDETQEHRAACGAGQEMRVTGFEILEILLAAQEGREPVEKLGNPPSLPAIAHLFGLIDCPDCLKILKGSLH